MLTFDEAVDLGQAAQQRVPGVALPHLHPAGEETGAGLRVDQGEEHSWLRRRRRRSSETVGSAVTLCRSETERE